MHAQFYWLGYYIWTTFLCHRRYGEGLSLIVSAGINILLCEFVSCPKGQRWIVQVVHMCKPYRLGLILTLDLKLSIHGRSRRCGWSVTQLGGTCAFVNFNHTNNIILETYRLHQTLVATWRVHTLNKLTELVYSYTNVNSGYRLTVSGFPTRVQHHCGDRHTTFPTRVQHHCGDRHTTWQQCTL